MREVHRAGGRLLPCPSSPQTAFGADPLKVGFIYVGPIGDHGWSYQHDQGRLAVEKALGKGVKTLYIEKRHRGSRTPSAPSRVWPGKARD